MTSALRAAATCFAVFVLGTSSGSAQGQVLSLKGCAKHTFTNTATVTATIVAVFGKAAAKNAEAAELAKPD